MNWLIERWPVNWSIERKLPLFVSVLLLAVVLGLLTIGYQQMRLAARAIASDRLQRSAIALAELSGRGPQAQRTQTATLAADSGVVAFLASGGRRGQAQALAALGRIARDTSSNAAAELWDAGGRLLLRSGRPTLAGEAFGSAESAALDSGVISPLIQRDTVLYFEVVANVRDKGRVVGRVQQVRRLALNAQTRAALTGLAGGNVLVLLGNTAGDPWTDFTNVVAAPPAVVRTSPILVRDTLQRAIDSTAAPVGATALIRYDRDEQKFGVAAPIKGTPWMILVELPRRVVLAPARAYRDRMAVIAALVLVVGAFGAWWVSRRITAPLRDITTAAEGIAGGDLRPRVDVRGEDELARLGRSFNTMAERVADAQHRLEEKVVERTAELESFSYSVSHDLRAPLRAIHGFARILQEDHKAQLDAEAQRLLGVIDQNTLRMGQLIDDLLAFSRLGRQDVDKARVDMRELAHSIADDVRRSESDRPLEITVDPLPPASGDRALLRQAVTNLVQNAAKFTRGRSPGRIEVGSRPDGGHTVYYVKDNGAGFDARYAGKLFGVFQRLHRADEFEGTGVGLAIVQRIVRRHGGRVWAEGQVDQGATFFFTLPASEG